MANDTPTPTPATGWAPKDELVELPSGNTARLLKKLSMKGLVRRGVLNADTFIAIVEGNLDDPVKALHAEAHIVAEMFVEPKVTLSNKPKNGEVHIDHLSDDDLAFVVERAFGGASEAASFRGDGRGDGAGADGEDVGKAAERDVGDGDGDAGGVPARQKPRRKTAGATA